jgi:hypothetical protein
VYRKKPRPPLKKRAVQALGGVEGTAKALGVSTRLIRIWMRRGISQDGVERLKSAWRIKLRAALNAR